MPVDDFLISRNATVSIEKYELVAPDNSKTDILLPSVKKEKAISSSSGMLITPGDLGLRKIALTNKSIEGTYQVIVESKPTFFTGYMDNKGKHRMSSKPMDEIDDAKSFDFSTRYKATGKSYFCVKNWTTPKAVGHDLEIMPTTDLSHLRAGDMVQFSITLKGEPVTCDMHGMHYIIAISNTFGYPDKCMMAAYIRDGKSQIRIPAAGEWRCLVLLEKKVTPDNALKSLIKKCQSVYYMATVSFNVNP